MRIGIVTWFGSSNYGTNLQAIALYLFLEKQGYQCELIAPFQLENILSKKISKRIISFFKWRLEKIIPFFLLLRNSLKSRSVMREIRNMKAYKGVRVRYTRNSQQYKELKKIDVFITGSDQIWNPNYLNTFYLLDFIEAKKIAYSSSIGVDSLPQNLVPVYQNSLKMFSHISVRELQGVDVLKKILGRNDIAMVLDPVFLLSTEAWNNYIDDAMPYKIDALKGEKYLFCYLIGGKEEYAKSIRDICQSWEIKKVVYIPSIENISMEIEGIKCKSAGIKEFVWYLKSASLVCTDSFHATAFCIIYKKDFIELMRFGLDDIESQNSRIIGLLSRYGLNSRIFYKRPINYIDSIDYSEIEKRLDEDIVYSKKYLHNAIIN